MKALVFDWEEDILDLLDYNLSKAGFQVLPVDHEDSILSIYTSYYPELVLIGNCSSLDKQREICQQIKALNAIGPQSLLICLTTEEVHCEPGNACHQHADLCIFTPVTPKSLLKSIEAHLPSLSSSTKVP